ncbi:MAG: hypothetical protein QXK94_02565 [Candidatus Jordarchaeales archaeon]
MEGDFLSLPHYDTLRKDAERNLEVGRFLNAAREFRVLSLAAEKDGVYELAGEFAAKSGDCWLKMGKHAAAATMYEHAAKNFHLAGKLSHAKSYFKKAFTEFLIASKMPETSTLDKVLFLVRAARCVSALGDQRTAKTLFSKACDLLVNFVPSYFSNEDYASAMLHYLIVIKLCEEMDDKEKACQVGSSLRELSMRFLRLISEKSVEEQDKFVQDLLKNLLNNPLLKEVLGQLPVLFQTLLTIAPEFQSLNVIQVLLNSLSPYSNPNSTTVTLHETFHESPQQASASYVSPQSEQILNLPLLHTRTPPEKPTVNGQRMKSEQFPSQDSTGGNSLDDLKQEEG